MDGNGGLHLAGTTTMLVIQNANLSVLAKAMNQQRVEGQAAMRLLQAAGATAPAAPPRGAPEPGKGSLVDVVA